MHPSQELSTQRSLASQQTQFNSVETFKETKTADISCSGEKGEEN